MARGPRLRRRRPPADARPRHLLQEPRHLLRPRVRELPPQLCLLPLRHDPTAATGLRSGGARVREAAPAQALRVPPGVLVAGIQPESPPEMDSSGSDPDRPLCDQERDRLGGRGLRRIGRREASLAPRTGEDAREGVPLGREGG